MSDPNITVVNCSAVDLELRLGALYNRIQAIVDSLEAGTESFFGPVGPWPVKDTYSGSIDAGTGIERCFTFIRGLDEELNRLMIFEEYLRNRLGTEDRSKAFAPAGLSAGAGLDLARTR